MRFDSLFHTAVCSLLGKCSGRLIPASAIGCLGFVWFFLCLPEMVRKDEEERHFIGCVFLFFSSSCKESIFKKGVKRKTPTFT